MSPRSAALGLTAVVVALALTATSSAAADRGHTDTQRAMDAAVRDDGVPGVLGQAEDGGGVWHGTAGTADRRTERPRYPDERFRVGSLTKTFIATVTLQLAAEGRLDLDSPVERWLPGTVRGKYHDGRRVTVRQLLRHTSGVRDFTADPRFQRATFGPRFLTHRYRSHTPARLAALAMERAPDFAPGMDWAYSNTNYVLVGMVIERVTGRHYAREVERRILRPLGLRDTSLPGTSARIPGPHGRAYSTLLATEGGASNDGPERDVTELNPSFAGASGEMISSTGDLVRFVRALLSGELLPRRQMREMARTVPVSNGGAGAGASAEESGSSGGAASGDRYGLGLTERTLSCGKRVWGHEGTIHGSRSVAFGTAGGRHAAAFTVNADWADDTGEFIEAEFC